MTKQIFLCGIIICCILGTFTAPGFAQQKKVRKAYVAGQFYPGNKDQLAAQIQDYLEQAEKIDVPGPLHALVAPHAGYIYSGPIAAYAYKQIEKPFKRIFILASNHNSQADVNGLSIPEFTHYSTPLGEVPVSPIAHALLKEDRISFIPEAHTAHIIEVHLPFLQTILEDFEIVPIITGRINWSDVERLGDLFNQYVDDETLFIVSTDLSHYHPYKDAVSLDTSCIYALEELDTQGIIDSELCGQGAALILLEIAKKQGWQGKILDYRNSGDTAGDKNRVVGYSSIAYYKPDKTALAPSISQSQTLSAEEQQILLELAEKTVELYVKKKNVFEPETEQVFPFRNLVKPRGTFVTLKKQGQLRGCIGDLIGRQPLFLGVRDNAIKAAVHDPRFAPVTEEELEEISVSISVLEVPQLLAVNSPEEYIETLTHQDGVILISGEHSSTYLPQVWEQLPDPVEFLSRLCVKGGSQTDCWKDPGTQIYTYRAQEFGEE